MSEELKYPVTDDMHGIRRHVRSLYSAMRARDMATIDKYLEGADKIQDIMILVNVLRMLAPGKDHLSQWNHAVSTLRQKLLEQGFTHPKVIKDVMMGIEDEVVSQDN